MAFALGAILIVVAIINAASIAISIAHGFTLRSLTGTRGVVLDIFSDIIVPLLGGIVLILAAKRLLNASHRRMIRASEKKGRHDQQEKAIDVFLNPDEKKVVTIIKATKGGVLQSDIVIKTGFSKVKAHRILKRLENKNLIKRGRFGITNKVILSD